MVQYIRMPFWHSSSTVERAWSGRLFFIPNIIAAAPPRRSYYIYLLCAGSVGCGALARSSAPLSPCAPIPSPLYTSPTLPLQCRNGGAEPRWRRHAAYWRACALCRVRDDVPARVAVREDRPHRPQLGLQAAGHGIDVRQRAGSGGRYQAEWGAPHRAVRGVQGQARRHGLRRHAGSVRQVVRGAWPRLPRCLPGTRPGRKQASNSRV